MFPLFDGLKVSAKDKGGIGEPFFLMQTGDIDTLCRNGGNRVNQFLQRELD